MLIGFIFSHLENLFHVFYLSFYSNLAQDASAHPCFGIRTGLFTAGPMAVATVVHIPVLLKEPPPLWPHDNDDRRGTFFPVMNALLGTTWFPLVYHYRLWPVDGTHFSPSSSTSIDGRTPFLLLVLAFWGLKVWYFRYQHVVQGWEKPWVDARIDNPMVLGLCLSLHELRWHQKMPLWFAPLMADPLYHLSEPFAHVSIAPPEANVT